NFLLRLPSALRMRIRKFVLRLAGVRMGRCCWIQDVMIPRNPWDVHLGEGVALDRQVLLLSSGDRTGTPRIVIGNGTYVNRFTIFDASERIEIGANCMIGPLTYIT